MTTIYVDGSAAREPDAADKLSHLAESGHDLVAIASAEPSDARRTGWAAWIARLPADPPRGSWFLTADPATCGDRRAGLRTMLIGPRVDGPRPTRCDVTVRDIRDAVLEILARDAMA